MGRPRKEKVVCSFGECQKWQYAKGLCNSHYARLLRHGDPSIVLPAGVAAGVKPAKYQCCSIDGCVQAGPFLKGLCGAHYARQKAHGDPLAGKPKRGVITHRSSQDLCGAEGCDRRVRAKGFCFAHLQRFHTYGDPRADIPIRKILPGVREYRDGSGYVGRWDTDTKSVMWDHRKAMSEYLGRPLLKTENVHHKNGIRSDNRIGNLELWASPQPYGQRVVDLIAFARDVLKTYAHEEEKLKALEDQR